MYHTKRILALVLCLLTVASLLFGCATSEADYIPMASVPETEPTTEPTTAPTTEPTTEPPTTEPPTTEPQPITYTLSFAGDCTLASDHNTYNAATGFIKVVGDKYDYPFQNALPYFSNDDFTLVNLECVLSGKLTPVSKKFRFRGPVENVKMLTAGSIEAVNLANNHTKDYGNTGYKNTLETLTNEKITYVESFNTATYTTASGLKIGLYAATGNISTSDIKNDVKKLRDEGAQIVIASFHWGVEYSYRPNATQKKIAHAAIDAGADIVVGHHPHVLQPVEKYGNGVIYYSLGNFCFGGNRNPDDKDTVLIQQLVIQDPDGTVRLGETKLIPFRVSSVTDKNDYKPTPLDPNDSAYKRVLSKLDGTFNGPDGNPNYDETTTAPSTAPTTSPTNPTTPSTTPTQPTETPTEPSTTPTTAPTEPTGSGGVSGDIF